MLEPKSISSLPAESPRPSCLLALEATQVKRSSELVAWHGAWIGETASWSIPCPKGKGLRTASIATNSGTTKHLLRAPRAQVLPELFST